MTKLKITVTKEILKESMYCGNIRRGQNCAIGKAIHNIFPNSRVGVGNIYFATTPEDIIRLQNDNVIWYPTEVPLPKEASLFILEFDSLTSEERILMDEIEFSIEIPDSVIETINIDDVKEIIENTPHLSLVN